ncbi:phosphatidylserine decarboxylase family protein [Cupriavidus sp. AU9028]|uniref:phosphatidylserine decarboxylase family protein n=1 Tax=Cupriavidus sp. AU9028 TaxID=2871157 RepID=UPI001C971D4B|nr:phosphatidylserine decarboxylase family protein [Cupriavidus sp. AU9028]MBY4899159.1 phosphatidylserine decarboxylase family protein [Cupriavidus sp. AU9028]
MTQSSEQSPGKTRHKRLGGWLPPDESAAAEFRARLSEAAQHSGDPKAQAVRGLHDLLRNDAALRLGMTNAIDEALDCGYTLGYRDIDGLVRILDYLMSYSPPFSDSSMVVCPFNAVVDWPMCMPSGYQVFRHPAFNAHLRHVLDSWSAFLSGPHSRGHLNTEPPNGWFSPEADKKIGLSQFLTHPDLPYWGFQSWNDFFTRRFRHGQRPVEGAGDDGVIVSPCEAKPYALRRDVALVDDFWIKSQPYSLRDMLGHAEEELARRYVGGTVYQAYLNAYSYHRWHAPVSGTVVRAYNIAGTYFSCSEAQGRDPDGLNDSQGYITAMATRAVIVIDTGNPAVGQIGCVFVGMGDVSSCVVEVVPGQRIQKGEELGYFQYGGSTICVLFEPDKVPDIACDPNRIEDPPIVKVNTRLASV